MLLIILQCATCDKDCAPDVVDNCAVCSLWQGLCTGCCWLFYSVQLVTGTAHRMLLIIVQCATCDRECAPCTIEVIKSRRLKEAAVCNTTFLLRQTLAASSIRVVTFIISCVDTTDTASSDTVPSVTRAEDYRCSWSPGNCHEHRHGFSVQNTSFVPRHVKYQS